MSNQAGSVGNWNQATLTNRMDRLVTSLLRHWLLILNTALGLFVGLPWLAPVLMHFRWEAPASWIYRIYSVVCHQLPERSWFLFGSTFTPSLMDIERVTGANGNFFVLRQFIGDSQLGWKLAWSDRMVSFYGGLFLVGVVYGLARQRWPGWRGLGWRMAGLSLLPMVVDGGTHAISDLWSTLVPALSTGASTGVGQGFRDSNIWLAAITGNLLSPAFYHGDAWGSFNSLARLATGLLAAAGLMLWLLPWLDRTLTPSE